VANIYLHYALDLWGFGDSDKSQERFTVTDYTNLLSDFMEGWALSRLHWWATP
jgi:pimeloyl-ACP methyl ester carboxylesterase